LNALKEFEREFLEKLLEDAIRKHIDLKAKVQVEERYREYRTQLKQAISIDQSAVPEKRDEE